MKNYLVINKLPEPQQREFRKWLVGQAMPIVEEEGVNKYDCAYLHDYFDWVNQLVISLATCGYISNYTLSKTGKETVTFTNRNKHE